MNVQIDFLKRCKELGLREGSLFAWLEKVEQLIAENEALKQQALDVAPFIDVGKAMVELTTTVRGVDEWPAIPMLWQMCMEERDSLKEQVVQLQADLAYSNLRVTALKVEWNKAYDIGVSVKHELSTLQSKSAALEKSRIGLVQWHVPENRYSAINAIDAALAAFKGEK